MIDHFFSHDSSKGVSIIVKTGAIENVVQLLRAFLLNNTYQPVEFIILDQDSGEGTSNAISKYAKDIFIRLVKRVNYSSLSKFHGLISKKTRFPYLLFLGDDISYTMDALPFALEKLTASTVGAVTIRFDDDPENQLTFEDPKGQHASIKPDRHDEIENHRAIMIEDKPMKIIEEIKECSVSENNRACVLLRKTDLYVLHGFFEQFNLIVDKADNTGRDLNTHRIDDKSIQYRVLSANMDENWMSIKEMRKETDCFNKEDIGRLPSISVVTVTYNDDKNLEKTIKNVIEMYYDNMEYIIVDGVSTDNSYRVLNRYSDKVDRIISEPDNGIYDAMNKGAQVATNDWIIFMNAGDLFYNKWVLYDLAKNNIEHYDFIYGHTYVDHQEAVWELVKAHGLENNIWKYNPFFHQSLLIRTHLVRKYKFDTSYSIVADAKLVYQLYLDGYKYRFFDFPISIFLSGGESMANEIELWKQRWKMINEFGIEDKNRVDDFYSSIISAKSGR